MKIVSFFDQKSFIFLAFVITPTLFAPNNNTISPADLIVQSCGQLISEQKTLLKLIMDLVFERRKKLENELRQASQQKERLSANNSPQNMIHLIERKVNIIKQQLGLVKTIIDAINYHDQDL